MKKANVLVIGNSGVGKSTLINAVLGQNTAKTGWGSSGTTKELEIYENEEIGFRIIDSIGFEPSFFKSQKAINEIKKWSKKSAKLGNEDNQINAIWFCVDGTAAKLFPETIKSLSKATSIWKSVPVIVVITKSYAKPERQRNIEMVQNVFAKEKRYSKNLKKIIPVVAQTFNIDENAFAAPDGIIELIDATYEVLPEGIRAANTDLAKFKLNRKRMLAQSVVVGCTTSAVTVSAANIFPIPDAVILAPLEASEITAIANIYGFKGQNGVNEFIELITKMGTVGIIAKKSIEVLKFFPIGKVPTQILNGAVAGVIVSSIGEGSIYAFEQVYLGNKTFNDIEWLQKFLETKVLGTVVKALTEIAQQMSNKTDIKDIIPIILKMIIKK